MSVSSAGYVTAKSPGDAVVTATSTVNGVSGYCYVHVDDVSPTGISISPSTRQSLAINSSLTFSYTLTPSYATSNVTWSMTGDTDAATLSSSGVLKGKSEGTVCVKATTDNGYSASCYVDIYRPVPNSITFDSNYRNITLAIGEGQTLSYTVQPSNAIYTTTWTSDAEDVATVTQSGYVVAKKTGTAHITVTTDNGKYATSTVTVPPQPTSIDVTPDEKDLLVGTNFQLSYQLTPSNAKTKSISWMSSDNSIATVTSSGLVRALSPGIVTIKATTDNGCMDVCTISIPEPKYCFYVWLNDGTIEGYAIEEKPMVTLGEDILTLSTNTSEVNYEAKNVVCFTLSDAALGDPTTGITPIPQSDVKVEFRAGLFTISNGKVGTPVMVYDIQGHLLSSLFVKPDEIQKISFEAYPAGIYIIKTKTASYKIIKK